jgi:hypothetical protein
MIFVDSDASVLQRESFQTEDLQLETWGRTARFPTIDYSMSFVTQSIVFALKRSGHTLSGFRELV